MGNEPDVRSGTAEGRWVLTAAVLGSGMVFLDGTVVNVALPAMADDLAVSITGVQWIVNAYLVTLTALLLPGGNLGDQLGRRKVFAAGLVAFTLASLVCGLAPSAGVLVAARAFQGIGGAMLVPGSLAIIAATFHPDDRGRAIGAWAALAGVASSIGPFVGGWLIDAVSWRLIFLVNLPLAAAAFAVTRRHVPETRAPVRQRQDVPGAALITLALGCLSYAAIEQGSGVSPAVALVGAAALVAFVLVERASTHPMLPLHVFRRPQFSGANVTTLAVYAGLGGGLFFLVLRLQVSLGYSALEAGAALTPFTLVMLAFSPAAGQLGQGMGARLPMTLGPIVAGAGLFALGGVGPGDTYVSGVLPGVLVFGAGMTLTVAPLTAAVLGSVGSELAGLASGVNNAVARLAGLLAVAALPALAGISSGASLVTSLDAGYGTALRIAAAVTALGGVAAAVAVRETSPVRPVRQPAVVHGCLDPCLEEPARGAAVSR